jgi:hypothetical protein
VRPAERREPSLEREALIATIWQRQWLARQPLVDSAGRELRVVYAGRRWGGAGPDFQGALLALPDGTLLRGDVEIHRRAADWFSHGHQHDPAYNNTILHVVLHASAGPPARRADGLPVPELSLEAHLDAPLAELAARPLAAEPPAGETACLSSADDGLRLVDRAGLERFFEQAARQESDLAALEPGEVLARGLLVALGYSANKRPAAQLGQRLPWPLIQRLGRGAGGEQRLRALLLGAAGLLPSQRGLPGEAGEPAALERHWRTLRSELDQSPLPATAWRLAGVRPENWPSRRLVGGAALLAGWANQRLPLDLLEPLLDRGRRPAALAELFRARSDADYWRRHYDFGTPTRGERPWQVGRPRAAEIVVNVLLPFAYAYGRTAERPDLAAAALLAYRALPAGAWNRPTLAMAAQLFGAEGRRVCRTAARQQGLLHLFKRFCWERRCEACPADQQRQGRAGYSIGNATVVRDERCTTAHCSG